MKRYTFSFICGEFNLTLQSNDEYRQHFLTKEYFKSLLPEDELDKLFADTGIVIGMADLGPRILRCNIPAPLELDKMLLAYGPGLTLPLGLPSEHVLKIGHLHFNLTVKYIE